QTYCILHMAKDVTDMVEAKEKEQNLTEELRAANEELLAAYEEANAINEELNESQVNLLQLYADLKESDRRFRQMVSQAPVGMCIITANDLFIQEVNTTYLELVGKHREEFKGRTIWEAVPEAAEAYAPVMNRVIQTGVPFIAKEHELILIRNGVPENV